MVGSFGRGRLPQVDYSRRIRTGPVNRIKPNSGMDNNVLVEAVCGLSGGVFEAKYTVRSRVLVWLYVLRTSTSKRISRPLNVTGFVCILISIRLHLYRSKTLLNPDSVRHGCN
jgi:hypothetical protein